MSDPTDAVHHRLESMPKETVTDAIRRRLVTGERSMFAQIFLDKGSVVPQHSHDNEQITFVLEGALRFWLGADKEDVRDVRSGEVLVIPPNLPHEAEALEDTIDFDVFTPVRQDWLDGTDTYFQNERSE